MLTISRQQAGKPRNSDSIYGIRKAVYLLQSVRIGSVVDSATCQGEQEDHSAAVKRSGREDVVCCPVSERIYLYLQHCVSYSVKDNYTFITMTPEIQLIACRFVFRCV